MLAAAIQQAGGNATAIEAAAAARSACDNQVRAVGFFTFLELQDYVTSYSSSTCAKAILWHTLRSKCCSHTLQTSLTMNAKCSWWCQCPQARTCLELHAPGC